MRVASLNAPRTVIAEYDEMLTWVVLALLSIGLVPVYASFNMLHNYKHRAEVFVSAVQEEAACASPA